MRIEKAVNKVLDDLPEDFTIRQFLLLNRSEVMAMSIFEYDEEKHMRSLRREGLREGIEKGRINNTVDLVSRKMKSSGMTFEEVCELFGLRDDEIAECRANMEKHN